MGTRKVLQLEAGLRTLGILHPHWPAIQLLLWSFCALPGKPVAYDYGPLSMNYYELVFGYSGLLFWATWLSRWAFDVSPSCVDQVLRAHDLLDGAGPDDDLGGLTYFKTIFTTFTVVPISFQL